MKIDSLLNSLSPGKRTLLGIVAVTVGVVVGILAIFEKPLIKAASDFFGSC